LQIKNNGHGQLYILHYDISYLQVNRWDNDMSCDFCHTS